MEFGKKYALVPEESLLKHVSTQSQISDFDKQMLQILNSSLKDYEKVRRYHDLLQKKLNMENYNLPWSTPTIVEEEKMELKQPSEDNRSATKEDNQSATKEDNRTTTKEDYSTMILSSVPKSSKKHADMLLQLIRKNPSILQWNDKGEILYNERSYPNSNLADLFHLIFTNRKRTNIAGKEEFLKALRELNVPDHYIKNTHLSNPVKQEKTSPILKRKSKILTVVKKKSDKHLSSVKPLRINKRWLSYEF